MRMQWFLLRHAYFIKGEDFAVAVALLDLALYILVGTDSLPFLTHSREKAIFGLVSSALLFIVALCAFVVVRMFRTSKYKIETYIMPVLLIFNIASVFYMHLINKLVGFMTLQLPVLIFLVTGYPYVWLVAFVVVGMGAGLIAQSVVCSVSLGCACPSHLWVDVGLYCLQIVSGSVAYFTIYELGILIVRYKRHPARYLDAFSDLTALDTIVFSPVFGLGGETARQAQASQMMTSEKPHLDGLTFLRSASQVSQNTNRLVSRDYHHTGTSVAPGTSANAPLAAPSASCAFHTNAAGVPGSESQGHHRNRPSIQGTATHTGAGGLSGSLANGRVGGSAVAGSISGIRESSRAPSAHLAGPTREDGGNSHLTPHGEEDSVLSDSPILEREKGAPDGPTSASPVVSGAALRDSLSFQQRGDEGRSGSSGGGAGGGRGRGGQLANVLKGLGSKCSNTFSVKGSAGSSSSIREDGSGSNLALNNCAGAVENCQGAENAGNGTATKGSSPRQTSPTALGTAGTDEGGRANSPGRKLLPGDEGVPGKADAAMSGGIEPGTETNTLLPASGEVFLSESYQHRAIPPASSPGRRRRKSGVADIVGGERPGSDVASGVSSGFLCVQQDRAELQGNKYALRQSDLGGAWACHKGGAENTLTSRSSSEGSGECTRPLWGVPLPQGSNGSGPEVGASSFTDQAGHASVQGAARLGNGGEQGAEEAVSVETRVQRALHYHRRWFYQQLHYFERARKHHQRLRNEERRTQGDGGREDGIPLRDTQHAPAFLQSWRRKRLRRRDRSGLVQNDRGNTESGSERFSSLLPSSTEEESNSERLAVSSGPEEGENGGRKSRRSPSSPVDRRRFYREFRGGASDRRGSNESACENSPASCPLSARPGGGGCYFTKRQRLNRSKKTGDAIHPSCSFGQGLVSCSGLAGAGCLGSNAQAADRVGYDFSPSCISSSCYSSSSDTRSSAPSSGEEQGSRKGFDKGEACPAADLYRWRRTSSRRRRNRRKNSSPSDSEHAERESCSSALPRVRRKTSGGHVTVNLVPSLPSRVFFDTFLNSVKRARELSRKESADKEVPPSGSATDIGKGTPNGAANMVHPPKPAAVTSSEGRATREKRLLEKYYGFVLPFLPPFPDAPPLLLEMSAPKEDRVSYSYGSWKSGATGCGSPASFSVCPASAVRTFPQTEQGPFFHSHGLIPAEGASGSLGSSGGLDGCRFHSSSPCRKAEHGRLLPGQAVSSSFLHRSTVSHYPQAALVDGACASPVGSRPTFSSGVSSDSLAGLSDSSSSYLSSQAASRLRPSPVVRKARPVLTNELLSTRRSRVADCIDSCAENRRASGNTDVVPLAEQAGPFRRSVSEASFHDSDRSERGECSAAAAAGRGAVAHRSRGTGASSRAETGERTQSTGCCSWVPPASRSASASLPQAGSLPGCSSTREAGAHADRATGPAWPASSWNSRRERGGRKRESGGTVGCVSPSEPLTSSLSRKKRKPRQMRQSLRNVQRGSSCRDEGRLVESGSDSSNSFGEERGTRRRSAMGGVCTLSPIAVGDTVDDDSVLLSPLLRSGGEEEQERDSQSDEDSASLETAGECRGWWLSSWLPWRGNGNAMQSKGERRRRCRETRSVVQQGFVDEYGGIPQDQLVGGWCDARDVSSVVSVSSSYLRRRITAGPPFYREQASSGGAYASSSTFSLSVEAVQTTPEQAVTEAFAGVPSSPPTERLMAEEGASVVEGDSTSLPEWQDPIRWRRGEQGKDGECGEDTSVFLSATVTPSSPASSTRCLDHEGLSSVFPSVVGSGLQREETGCQAVTRSVAMPGIGNSSLGKDSHTVPFFPTSTLPHKRCGAALASPASLLLCSRRAVFLSDGLHQTEGPSESPRQRLDPLLDPQVSSSRGVTSDRGEEDRGAPSPNVVAGTGQSYRPSRAPTGSGVAQAPVAGSQDVDLGCQGGEVLVRSPSFPHYGQIDGPRGVSSAGPQRELSSNRQVISIPSQRGREVGMAAEVSGGSLPRLPSTGGALVRGGGGGVEQPGRGGEGDMTRRGGADRLSGEARHASSRRARSRGRPSNGRPSSKAKRDKSKMLRYHLVQKFHDRLPWWVARIIVYADAALENCRRRRRLMQRATWKTKVAMPVRNMLGLFSDEKIETWYVQWLNAFNAKYYPRVAWLLLLVCIYATAFHGLMRVRSFVENYTICRDAVRASRLGEAGFLVLLGVRFASQPILSVLLMLPVLRHTGSKLVECITCSESPTTPLKSYKLYRWMLALSILQSVIILIVISLCVYPRAARLYAVFAFKKFAFAVFDNTWHLILNSSTRHISPLTLIPASTSLEVAIVQSALLLAVRAPTITFLFMVYLIVYFLVFFLVLPPAARQIELFTVSLAGWLFTCLGAQIFYTRAFEVNRRRVFCKYVLPYMLYLEEIAAILYSTPQGELPDDFSDDDVSLVSANLNERSLQQGN